MYLVRQNVLGWPRHDHVTRWDHHVTWSCDKVPTRQGSCDKIFITKQLRENELFSQRRQFVVNHEICFAKPKFNFNHVIKNFQPNWTNFGHGSSNVIRVQNWPVDPKSSFIKSALVFDPRWKPVFDSLLSFSSDIGVSGANKVWIREEMDQKKVLTRDLTLKESGSKTYGS